MIVIDASTLAKYLLREENWEQIEGYLIRGVYSVDHIVKEVANAIWKHVVIRKVISVDLGLKVFYELKKLVSEGVVRLEDQSMYIDRAMEIALTYGITFYDSLYIAQALRYGELLTSDEAQAEVAKALGIKTYFIE